MSDLWTGPTTVADFIKALSEFPPEWRVVVSTPAGGGFAIKQRDVKGKPVVGIFGKNGGRFGENPLTEEEYRYRSENFQMLRRAGYLYTTIHGDHRLHRPDSDTCYGIHFDRRVIERMVNEGLIQNASVDIDRVAAFDR